MGWGGVGCIYIVWFSLVCVENKKGKRKAVEAARISKEGSKVPVPVPVGRAEEKRKMRWGGQGRARRERPTGKGREG